MSWVDFFSSNITTHLPNVNIESILSQLQFQNKILFLYRRDDCYFKDEGKTLSIKSVTRTEITLDYGFRRSHSNFYDDSKFKCGRFVWPLVTGKPLSLLWTMFVLSAFVYLPLNIILIKRNNKGALSDVSTVLRVICGVQAVLDVFVYACSLFFLIQDMVYYDIFSSEYSEFATLEVYS